MACAAISGVVATTTVTTVSGEEAAATSKEKTLLSSSSEESFSERKDEKQREAIPMASVTPRSYSISSSSTDPPPSRSRPRCRTPQCSQFASRLTRCRQCKKSKQGAVFCRVVRMHREDGFDPPPGFEEWLVQYNASQEGRNRSGSGCSGGGAGGKRGRMLHLPPAKRRRIRRENCDRDELVWRPPDSMTDQDVGDYLAGVDAGEEEALRALLAANYDKTQVLLPPVKANVSLETTLPLEDATNQAFAAACSLLLDGGAERRAIREEATHEPADSMFGKAQRSARKMQRCWTDEDVHRFGEALLECDRDCGGALKKLRRRTEAFAQADVGDILDLYYGIFKASGRRYDEWKARLRARRGPAVKNQEADKFLLQSGDVFDCPCGCGGVVDNRGRPSSHRRKWATRSCRDRAARGGPTASRDDEGGCSSGGEVSSSSCCGDVASTSRIGRATVFSGVYNTSPPQQRSRRRTGSAAAAARQRQPDRPPRANSATDGTSASSSKDRIRRPTLVRRGLTFGVDDECFRVEGRCSRRDGWLVRWIGGPRQGEILELTAVSIASRAIRSVVVDDTREKSSYRGVTKKGSDGCSSRYNAAFSLLGDRFSLGAFETAVDAARAWDVVAWASGRDDLNVSTFAPPKPTPSKGELQALANTLRDAVRLRTRPVSELDEDYDLDAVDADGSIVKSCRPKRRPRRAPSPQQQRRSGGDLPGILYAPCLERLTDDKFTVGLGSVTASRGRALVATARLRSRKWLVECFHQQGETLFEMDTEELQSTGDASFALVSRGTLDAADCPETVEAVRSFCRDQLVDRRLKDGRTIKDVVVTDDATNTLVARAVSLDGSAVELDLISCRRQLLQAHRAAARLLLAEESTLQPPDQQQRRLASENVEEVSKNENDSGERRAGALGGVCLLPPLSVA